jgi:hypothetical protein
MMRLQRSVDSFRGQRGAVQEALGKILLIIGKIGFMVVPAVVLLTAVVGCRSRDDPATATSDPVAKVRLTRINKFYRLYSNQHKKPPSDEKAFKDFVRSLPQDEKDAALIKGDDVDSLFVSPRDGQKYHIEYGLVARPEGPNRALAWEETGQKGMRYVALTMGYVKECGEEEFQKYAKKK